MDGVDVVMDLEEIECVDSGFFGIFFWHVAYLSDMILFMFWRTRQACPYDGLWVWYCYSTNVWLKGVHTVALGIEFVKIVYLFRGWQGCHPYDRVWGVSGNSTLLVKWSEDLCTGGNHHGRHNDLSRFCG